MDQIVLQISDVNNNVFVNPGRILSYLNRFFVKYMNSMQYCEDLANGFLFIFQNLEAFKIRTKPLAPAILKNVNPKVPRVNFFQFFFVSAKNFPPEGVDVQIKVVSGNPKEVIPRTQAFILSVDSRITFKRLNTTTFNFHVKSYQIIQKYLNSLLRRFFIGKSAN
ncbi:hypothetical protein [Candidatus Lokiarchaeum ossiferum]|uniref:hypothetical protein n=1 Tax=Candidatus Lokiarchaeum ossiferum TaxID=2951803 RepID=UPI00352EA8AD